MSRRQLVLTKPVIAFVADSDPAFCSVGCPFFLIAHHRKPNACALSGESVGEDGKRTELCLEAEKGSSRNG